MLSNRGEGRNDTVERNSAVSGYLPLSAYQPPSGKIHSSFRRNDLARSLIPSDKYMLKNLTFVVRIYSCVYVTTLVISFRLRGQGIETKVKLFTIYLSEGMSDPGKVNRSGK